MNGPLGYVVAAALGLLVGASELAGRYRDSIAGSLLRPAALFYLAVNAGAGAFTLLVVRTFEWSFGQPPGPARELLQVLLSGLGAVALLRTKLFSASEQGTAMTWSPGGLLERLLAISDRQVDRAQAVRRTRAARRVMMGVSFDKASTALPTYALALVENPSPEDEEQLSRDVKALLADTTMDEAAKVQILGVMVLKLAGLNVLQSAVAGLGDAIKHVPRPVR